MQCYHPLTAYKSKQKTKSGKQGITFKKADSLPGQPIQLPCGQCIGCRLKRSVMWATRCMHEAQMHDENSFITLTYNDENLPEDYSLKKKIFRSL